jgi:hypothetical protein
VDPGKVEFDRGVAFEAQGKLFAARSNFQVAANRAGVGTVADGSRAALDRVEQRIISEVQALQPDERAALMGAILQLKRFASALSIGLPKVEYGRRLADAKIAADESLSQSVHPSRPFRAAIDGSFALYSLALDIWDPHGTGPKITSGAASFVAELDQLLSR